MRGKTCYATPVTYPWQTFTNGISFHSRFCTFESMAWKRFVLLTVCCWMLKSAGFCQQYSFTNYSVGQGLVQSQARDIIQDGHGYIWVATLGGLSRFDGSYFHNYTRKNGMHSLITFRVCQGDNKIYAGTQHGIQSFDGRNFETCALPADITSSAVMDIVQAKNNRVFFRASGRLFAIEKDNSVLQEKELKDCAITSLYSDQQQNVFAAARKQGIYKWNSQHWELFLDLKEFDSTLVIQRLFVTSSNQLLLLSNKGIFSVSEGKPWLLISNKTIASPLTAIAEDDKGRLWVGTTSGAWLLDDKGSAVYIGGSSGLTDNTVVEIIKDRESNLWFATDGDGIFKLNNSPLTYVNKEQGMKGNVVMGVVAENENDIWLGTSEHGLQRYAGGRFYSYPLPSPHPQAQKTNSLFLDAAKQLWIGTMGGGLWRYKNNQYQEIRTSTGAHFKEVISIYEDAQHTIWACAPSGLYYFSNGTMHNVQPVNYPCFSVIESGPGTILVGTTAGLYQLAGKSVLSPVNIGIKNIGIVNCFAKWKDYFLLGTEDKGIIFWNPSNARTLQCSSKNGLSSDFVFSLYADTGAVIFAGTEHGVSSILFDEKRNSFVVKNHSAINSIYGPECNLNAVQKTRDGRLWFGTTKGMVLYNPADTFSSSTAPLIYLTGVKLFSNPINADVSQDSLSGWDKIPYHLSLTHRQNHLTFNFTGLYFTNPAGIKYRYRLQGADTGYSEPASTAEVIYSNLSPGQYRFTAYAIAENGLPSSNSIDFSFYIEAPFYQQLWFKLLAILMLVVTGILLQYSRTRLKMKREIAISKIKLEEQLKIQERTSEDLHDDLGNKITRISILTDVLGNKIDKDDVEKRKLIEQIKENAQALYLGTKDIIWSLTPGNDSLYDVLERCKSFGAYLFEETNVEFSMEGLKDNFREIKLPLQINRNLVLIIKEALNNIIKHSGATHVRLKTALTGNGDVLVTITDDGKGIGDGAQRKGNGLANMEKRALRMGGHFTINRSHPSGTTLEVSFKIPPKEG
jgi:signal transduction histidine kinase/ligand-binding sensor domain-containing protein